MTSESETNLEQIGRRIADRIGAELDEFGGHAVRADAGKPGMIYVALRGAKGDVELGGQFAERVGELVDELLEDRQAAFAVSMGAGDDDLLLQIEVRPSDHSQ